jgi:hypothetical protein
MESSAIAKQRRRVLTNDSGIFQTGIGTLVKFHNEVQVIPMRKANCLTTEASLTNASTGVRPEDFVNLPALEKLRHFYEACDCCDLQKAAIRIVKSTAWREMVFPVDTRTCQIEL